MRTTSYAAFIRGINVGGKSLIGMPVLIKAVEKAGFKDVRAYIQSGNLVLKTDKGIKTASCKLDAVLSDLLGTHNRAILKTREELATIVKQAPKEWKGGADVRRYLAFVMEPAKTDDVIREVSLKKGIDSIKRGKGVVYMTTILSGISKSGFSRLASKPIYKHLTIRAYSTAQKVLELMDSSF